MLGEFVDSLKDSQSKDVANGIWNTLWEMGGSVGFLISGIPQSNDWRSEEIVIGTSSIALLFASLGFFFITEIIRSDSKRLVIEEIKGIDDDDSEILEPQVLTKE